MLGHLFLDGFNIDAETALLVEHFAQQLGPSAEEVYMTTAEQLRREGETRGIAKGIAKGYEKGKPLFKGLRVTEP